MPAVVIALADAVVEALNAAGLSLPFAARRAYVPVYDEADLVDLRVTVVPRELALETLARDRDDFTYGIDVAIQKLVEQGECSAAETIAVVDPLMQLVEEVVDLFRGRAPAGYPAAACVGTANRPIYLPDHLDERTVFTSVVSLTFRVARRR